MTTRRRAREIVLQVLFEEDLNPDQDQQVADQFLVNRMHGNRPLVEFSRRLVSAVRQHRKELDRNLSAHATNWSVRRMAAIDRNILRLGAYELLHTDTPGRVVINEAVELAKRYGDRQSSQFVNGILDRVLRSQVGDSAEKSAAAEGPEPATLAASSAETNSMSS
jgi:transcription antitermination protein NusB